MKKFFNFVNEKIKQNQFDVRDQLYEIVNYIKKNADHDIYEYNENFQVTKQDTGETLNGILYLTTIGKALRFNFLEYDLVSIDFWNNFKFDYEKITSQPDFTLEIEGIAEDYLDDVVDFINGELFEAKKEIKKAPAEDVKLNSITISKNVLDFDIDVFDAIKYFTMQVAYGKSNSLIVSGLPGLGKCLGKGTKIIMADGKLKNVEDIKIGDQIMGPDSLPRNILGTCSGLSNLYEVQQNKGINYVVNEHHILSLKKSKKAKNNNFYKDYDDIVNIPIKDYINQKKCWKDNFYGYKVDINFDKKNVPIDPYFLGLWLGDGTSIETTITTIDEEVKNYVYEYAKDIGQIVSLRQSPNRTTGYHIISEGYNQKGVYYTNKLYRQMKELNLINNKHIPDVYLYNDKKTRLELLAGLIDTDGYTTVDFTGYEIIQKSEILINQIKFLADSLGFKTRLRKRKCNIKSVGFESEYFRLSINGNLEIVPVKIERKKINPKRKVDHKITGIKIKDLGQGEYFGFEIDGDHLFLLEDCTVTHNTSEVEEALETSRMDYVSYKGDITLAGLYETLFINRHKLIVFDDCDSVFDAKNKECINLLKAALDTKKERKVSRVLKTHFDSTGMDDKEIQKTYEETGQLPKQFTYDGRIIIITNVTGENIDEALISRGLHVDVNLTENEVLERMRKIMDKLFPSYPMEKKEETLEFMHYLITNYESKFALNIRTLIHCLNIRVSNDFTIEVGGEKVPVWQLLVKQYLLKK